MHIKNLHSRSRGMQKFLAISVIPFFLLLFSCEILANYGIYPTNNKTKVEIFSDPTITIKYPNISTKQNMVAPYRDFYVIGLIDNKSASIPSDSRLIVSLYNSKSTLVQEVETNIKDNKNGLNIQYSRLTTANRNLFKQSAMPDLVYDPDVENSFKDVWRKSYYTDTFFTAQFVGGAYKTDLNLVDKAGNPIPPLNPDDYVVKVTLENSIGFDVASTQVDIIVQYSPQKVLARFSPPLHMQRVTANAKANHYHMYLDPFPGYWDTANVIKGVIPTPMFGEILPRWKMADGLEYEGGKSFFYIYNVTETSATYSVEIGTLQYIQKVTKPKYIQNLYYNIGEPILPRKKLSGEFLFMPSNEKLELTRIDYQIYSDKPQDNTIDMNILPKTESSTTFVGRINVPAGKYFSVYGVVAPIQNLPQDIVKQNDNSYKIKNYISHAIYKIKDEVTGAVVSTITKDISGLIRINLAGIPQKSILEFKHDIIFNKSEIGRNYIVSLAAYDKYSTFVEGTAKSFLTKVVD